MKSVDDLLTYIRPYSGSMPISVVKRNISETISEFTRDSGVLRQEITTIIKEGSTSAFISPDMGVIDDVIGVKIDGITVERKTGIGDSKRGYEYLGDEELAIYPAPSKDSTIVANSLIKTDVDSEYFPDFLLKDYRKALVSGSIAKIAEIPGGNWHNPETYNRKIIEYNIELNEAKRKMFAKNGSQVKRRSFV